MDLRFRRGFRPCQNSQLEDLYTLQLGQVPPGGSARTLLPMLPHQNISQGPPSTLLQVAVKNNQQPVMYFNARISLHVFFSEDGKMERTSFLDVS